MCVCVCVFINVHTWHFCPFTSWWHLRFFAILRNAFMNIGVHVSLWTSVFVLFGYILETGISESYDNSTFRFLGNFHSVFRNGWTKLFQCMMAPFASQPWQHFTFVVFLMIASLRHVMWYLIVVLICIFLMITNVEHLFMCLLAIFISSLEKCLPLSAY